MKLGLRASKSEENEKKRQEAIKTEAELRLEQKISEYNSKLSNLSKERAALEKTSKEEMQNHLEDVKQDFVTLHNNAQKNGLSTFNSNDNQTRVVLKAFSDYSDDRSLELKSKLDFYSKEHNTATTKLKAAEENFDKASKAYDEAEASKALATKKADDAKNSIPPQEVERLHKQVSTDTGRKRARV